MASKTRVNRWLWVSPLLVLTGYVGSYWFLYSAKEQQTNRYRSRPLPTDFRFTFPQDVEELTFRTANAGSLNALLFKTPNAKGVVCFWKGNGGTLENWGTLAPRFLALHYDVLMTDYRQHGKSKGVITLANFHSDAQAVYDYLKQRYRPDSIIVIGFSLGGRVAAQLAADNQPKLTVLLDPASAGGDFSDRVADFVFYPLPSVNGFVFQTESAVRRAKRPVAVFSTENTPSLAYQLKPLLSQKDAFYVVPGASHETMLTHPQVWHKLSQLLR